MVNSTDLSQLEFDGGARRNNDHARVTLRLFSPFSPLFRGGSPELLPLCYLKSHP